MKKTFRVLITLFSLILALSSAMVCLPVAATEEGATAPVWNGSAAESFAQGSGTEEEPYQIGSVAELALLAAKVNGGENQSGVYFVLTADLVLNDTADFENWGGAAPANAWIPIGNNTKLFAGTFDGNNKTVSGLYLSVSSDYIGLFGGVSGTVKNLTITESYLSTTASYVGAVAGTVTGTLENCRSSATVFCGNMGGGGVAGSCIGGTITGCQNSGSVTGLQQIGGIVGALGGTVSKCENSGAVKGTKQFTGGIVGIMGASKKAGSVDNCINTGRIESVSTAGGIAGRNGNVAGCSIASCINGGFILSGDNYGGHIYGSQKAGNAYTVSDCFYDKTASAATVGSYGSNSDKIAEATACEKAQLIGPSALSTVGFSDEIWEASVTGYPRLKALHSGETDSTLVMLKGAGIRTVTPTGMRWQTQISKTAYDALKGAGATVKIGTLITPTQYVQAADAFTKEALDAAKEIKGWDVAYLDVAATDGEWFNSNRKDTDDYIFAGSIGEIMPEHYELLYSAIGYMEITFADGQTVTLYSEYVEQDHARTVAQVAAAALADENNGLNDEQIAEIQKFVSKENA